MRAEEPLVPQQERTTFHIEANVEDKQLYRIYQTYKDFTGKDCIGFYRTLPSSTFINIHNSTLTSINVTLLNPHQPSATF